MLQMRPVCECCDADLAPESPDARICTFECTFCAACVDGPLAGTCPNCGGNFEKRPTRPAHLLDKYPPSTARKGPTAIPSTSRGEGGAQAEGLGG